MNKPLPTGEGVPPSLPALPSIDRRRPVDGWRSGAFDMSTSGGAKFGPRHRGARIPAIDE